jgi:hypothetical protein
MTIAKARVHHQKHHPSYGFPYAIDKTSGARDRLLFDAIFRRIPRSDLEFTCWTGKYPLYSISELKQHFAGMQLEDSCPNLSVPGLEDIDESPYGDLWEQNIIY